MKANYQAWEVDIENLTKQKNRPDLLRYLINFAVLAPSSHNSQPWLFEIKDDQILISANRNRSLPASDRNERQLYISLGCAITNICVAAEHAGFKVKMENINPVTTSLKIEEAKNGSQGGLIFSILTRANNRNPYEKKVPPQAFMKKIKEEAPEKFRIDFIEDASDKKNLADIAIRAGIAAMNDKKFRQELSEYVKSNITNSPVGMPGFGMGIPTPISLIAPTMLRYLNMNKVTAKKDLLLLTDYTPVIAIISCLDDNYNSWLAAGQYFEKIALEAEAEKIKTGVWAAPIQIEDYYKEIQTGLGIKERPLVFFRMGYTESIPHHSPRLVATTVIKQ